MTTYDALYAEAKQAGIKGRSKMTKAELEAALYPSEDGYLTPNPQEAPEPLPMTPHRVEKAKQLAEAYSGSGSATLNGVSALSSAKRSLNYSRQNGTSERYTPKQLKRSRKKARHAAKHARTIKAA